MGHEPLREREIHSVGRLRRAGIAPWASTARGTGAWMRIRPGEYLDKERWHTLTPLDRHRALVVATVRRMREPLPMLSHFAAAALWGMPIIGPWPDRVDVMLDAAPPGPARWCAGIECRAYPSPRCSGPFR